MESPVLWRFSPPLRSTADAGFVRIGHRADAYRPMCVARTAHTGGSRNVDARPRQPLEVLVTSFRIKSMDGLLAAFEAVINERNQHAILVIVDVEKRADMTWRAKH